MGIQSPIDSAKPVGIAVVSQARITRGPQFWIVAAPEKKPDAYFMDNAK